MMSLIPTVIGAFDSTMNKPARGSFNSPTVPESLCQYFQDSWALFWFKMMKSYRSRTHPRWALSVILGMTFRK